MRRFDEHRAEPPTLAAAVKRSRDRDERLQDRRLQPDEQRRERGGDRVIACPAEVEVPGDHRVQPADDQHPDRPDRNAGAIGSEFAAGTARDPLAAQREVRETRRRVAELDDAGGRDDAAVRRGNRDEPRTVHRESDDRDGDRDAGSDDEQRRNLVALQAGVDACRGGRRQTERESAAQQHERGPGIG
jgi:hypothetical protein